jgi:hypothetical protein
MPTIHELLRAAAAVPREPLDWDRVRRLGRRRRVARQAGAAAVAVVVLAVGVASVVNVRTGGGPPAPPATAVPTTAVPTVVPTAATPPTGPFDDLAAGWTSLPAPPEVRVDAATQWTGQTLLIWGGSVPAVTAVPESDGMVFEPRTSTWSEMAPSPLSARTHPGSVWTGTALLVWGGLAGDSFSFGLLGDGAAYDPHAREWRPLPPAPIGPRAPLSVWTGAELIVWGTAVRGGSMPRDGAAYRPATDTWRRIADAPIEVSDAVAVWTGREMIVFGAALSPANNAPATPTAIGAAYNPATDTWRSLPASPLSPQASTAAWNGRELIAWDYETEAEAYDPDRDVWRSLPRIPFDPVECYPRSARVAAFVVGEFCGGLAVFDGVRWRDASLAGVDGWIDLAPAGPVVLVLGIGDPGGAPAGWPPTGTPRLFAYRPGP